MRKWLIAFSLLAALLGLAACGGPEEQAATPAICYYNGSYYNSEGQKLVEFGTDCRILCDAQGHSCYLLQKEVCYAEPVDLAEFDDDLPPYERPVLSCSFKFYDVYGQLVQTVDLQQAAPNSGAVRFYFAPDGNLSKSVFVLDLLREEGHYQLLDYTGQLLVEGSAPKLTDRQVISSVWVELGEGFVGVNYSTMAPGMQIDGHQFCDMYDLAGQPFPAGQVYDELRQVSLRDMGRSQPLLYKASYRNVDGRRRFALLDASGNVLQGNLLFLEYQNNGVFLATQGWGQLVQGFMDTQGRWLPNGQEPLLFTSYGGFYNSYGLLLPDTPPLAGQACLVDILQGRYILKEEYQYAEKLESSVFTLLDNWGNVLSQAEVPGRGQFMLPPDGRPEQALILLNKMQTTGGYQLFDASGCLLQERQMVEPSQVDYVYTFNVEAPGFLALNYNIQERGQKTQRWADIYDWQGQPLQLAEDYFQIDKMYDFYYMKELHNVRTERTGYYEAKYQSASGETLVDVLDGQGRVVLSGLTNVSYHGEGIFWVQQGFSQGLMNDRGEWICQEPLPEED